MGLASTKVRQKLGHDPRNTNWSNDTDRFGHQYLEKMGWAPGQGLGLVGHATVSHVKVSLKADNEGLGAKLHRKKNNKDDLDLGDCAGLDAFQRILGRLNGKEEAVSSALDQQRKDRIINGKWGMHFVKGSILSSTWDTKSKSLRESTGDCTELKKSRKRSGTQKDCKKRHREYDTGLSSEVDEKDSKNKKRRKKNKESVENLSIGSDIADTKQEKHRKHKKDKRTDNIGGEGKSDKKDIKESRKKEKKQEKDKKENKENDKKDKEDKKKKDKTRKNKKEEGDDDTWKTASGESVVGERQIASRLAVRSKWIKQKRASVMDAKALNEIFMISK